MFVLHTALSGNTPGRAAPFSAHSCVLARPSGTIFIMVFSRPAAQHNRRETFVAGKPGGYASLLARRARLKTLAALSIVSLCLWFSYANRSSFASSGVSSYLAPAALIAASISGALARLWWGKAAAASVGARSEKIVARALYNQSPVAILHSVDLKAGGDADHMVLGPKLVVIETKTGSGVVSYKDGKLYVGNKALRGDPIAQCRRQALAAKKVLGTYCEAVVCVVNMSNSPFTVGSVTVASSVDLSSVFAGFQDRLRPDVAWARALELAPQCSTIHEKPNDSSKTNSLTKNSTNTKSGPSLSNTAPKGFARPLSNQSSISQHTSPISKVFRVLSSFFGSKTSPDNSYRNRTLNKVPPASTPAPHNTQNTPALGKKLQPRRRSL